VEVVHNRVCFTVFFKRLAFSLPQLFTWTGILVCLNLDAKPLDIEVEVFGSVDFVEYPEIKNVEGIQAIQLVFEGLVQKKNVAMLERSTYQCPAAGDPLLWRIEPCFL